MHDTAEELHHQLQLRENELRQRLEEIEQARSDLARVRSELAQAQSERDELRSRFIGFEQRLAEWGERFERAQAELKAARAAAEASEEKLSERGKELARNTDLLRTRDTELKTEKLAAERRLGERFKEIATLSRMLAEQEAEARRSNDEAAWLAEVTSVLATRSTTLKGRLLALLPTFVQQKRHRRILKSRGLFDSEAYLVANPDVADEGAEPLPHYLSCGIKENRRRG